MKKTETHYYSNSKSNEDFYFIVNEESKQIIVKELIPDRWRNWNESIRFYEHILSELKKFKP